LLGYSLPKEAKKYYNQTKHVLLSNHTTGQTTSPKMAATLIGIIREKILFATEISIVKSDVSAMKCKYALHSLATKN